MLKKELMQQLDSLSKDQLVMLKISLPEQANFYKSCLDHPNVLKLVALSGGYSLSEATRRLTENQGMIASFSRVLTDNLSVNQSNDDFNKELKATLKPIALASNT